MPGFAIKADRDEFVKERMQRFGAAIEAVQEADLLCLRVEREILWDVLKALRDECGFGFLTTLCGMHFPNDPLDIGIVYHLHAMREGHRIRVKSRTSLKEPEFRSVTELWPAANWMERETFDFFGIRFTGHPNLKRILNMEGFPAFPMLKDYPREDPTRRDKDDSFFGR